MLAYLFEVAVPLVGYNWMGRRQAVRHKVLILAFGGSNPSAPANLIYKSSWFLNLEYDGDTHFIPL